MTSATKDVRNRKLGAYPTPYQTLMAKSLDQVQKIKAGLPARIKAAGSIINAERRQKCLAKLQGEWQLVESVLKDKQKEAA